MSKLEHALDQLLGLPLDDAVALLEAEGMQYILTEYKPPPRGHAPFTEETGGDRRVIRAQQVDGDVELVYSRFNTSVISR